MMIEMEGFAVKLIRKRVKNLNLRIDSGGEVSISAPMRFPFDLITRFLSDKREWIEHHRNKLQAMPDERINMLETGDMLFFLGQRYELFVHESSMKNGVEINSDTINLYIKQAGTINQKQIILNRWYREQMQLRLPALFEKWEAVIGVKANDYGIKIMKTRWGSCNTIKKRIWLNLRLIHKSPMCLEYVIVHELVHLLEPSHNKRFYVLMEHYMPDWKRVKMLLESIKSG